MGAALEVVGRHALVGVEGFFPSHFAVIVTRHASHDAHQGAARDIARLVDGNAAANMFDQRLMFLDVRIEEIALERPLGFAADPVLAVGASFGSNRDLVDAAESAGNLFAQALHVGSIGELVIDGVMIPYIAARLPSASAKSRSFYRIFAFDPAANIEIMHVLLDDVVAGKPQIVIPIAYLELDFRHALSARAKPDRAAAPVDVQGADVADGAVVQALDGLDIVTLMSALRARRNREAFVFCGFARRDDLAYAGRIDGGGLLHKDVLVIVDGFGQRPWTKHRRIGQDDVVRVAGDDAFVCVPPSKALVVFNGLAEVVQHASQRLKVVFIEIG